MEKGGFLKKLVGFASVAVTVGVAISVSSNRSREAMRRLEIEEAKQRYAELRGQAVREANEKGALDAKTGRELERLGRKLGREGGELAPAPFEYEGEVDFAMGVALGVVRHYRQMADEARAKAAGALSLDGVAPENLEERTAALDAYREASAKQVERHAKLLDEARETLAERGVPDSSLDEAILELLLKTDGRLATAKRLRELDVAEADAMASLVAALKASPGGWERDADSGEFVWGPEARKESVDAVDAARRTLLRIEADRRLAASHLGGGAADSSGAANVPAAASEARFEVVVASYDAEKKIFAVKAVRQLGELGLKEAKDLVEGAPATLLKGVSREEAEKAKAELEAAGVVVEIK